MKPRQKVSTSIISKTADLAKKSGKLATKASIMAYQSIDPALKQTAAALNTFAQTARVAKQHVATLIENSFTRYANQNIIWYDSINHVPAAISENDTTLIKIIKYMAELTNELDKLGQLYLSDSEYRLKKLYMTGIIVDNITDTLSDLYSLVSDSNLGKEAYATLDDIKHALTDIDLNDFVKDPSKLEKLIVKLIDSAFSYKPLRPPMADEKIVPNGPVIESKSSAMNDEKYPLIESKSNSPKDEKSPSKEEMFPLFKDKLNAYLMTIEVKEDAASRLIMEEISQTMKQLKKPKINSDGFYILSDDDTHISRLVKSIANVTHISNSYASRLSSPLQSAYSISSTIDEIKKIYQLLQSMINNPAMHTLAKALANELTEVTRKISYNVTQFELHNHIRPGLTLSVLRNYYDPIAAFLTEKNILIKNPFILSDSEIEMHKNKILELETSIPILNSQLDIEKHILEKLKELLLSNDFNTDDDLKTVMTKTYDFMQQINSTNPKLTQKFLSEYKTAEDVLFAYAIPADQIKAFLNSTILLVENDISRLENNKIQAQADLIDRKYLIKKQAEIKAESLSVTLGKNSFSDMLTQFKKGTLEEKQQVINKVEHLLEIKLDKNAKNITEDELINSIIDKLKLFANDKLTTNVAKEIAFELIICGKITVEELELGKGKSRDKVKSKENTNEMANKLFHFELLDDVYNVLPTILDNLKAADICSLVNKENITGNQTRPLALLSYLLSMKDDVSKIVFDKSFSKISFKKADDASPTDEKNISPLSFSPKITHPNKKLLESTIDELADFYFRMESELKSITLSAPIPLDEKESASTSTKRQQVHKVLESTALFLARLANENQYFCQEISQHKSGIIKDILFHCTKNDKLPLILIPLIEHETDKILDTQKIGRTLLEKSDTFIKYLYDLSGPKDEKFDSNLYKKNPIKLIQLIATFTGQFPNDLRVDLKQKLNIYTHNLLMVTGETMQLTRKQLLRDWYHQQRCKMTPPHFLSWVIELENTDKAKFNKDNIYTALENDVKLIMEENNKEIKSKQITIGAFESNRKSTPTKFFSTSNKPDSNKLTLTDFLHSIDKDFRSTYDEIKKPRSNIVLVPTLGELAEKISHSEAYINTFREYRNHPKNILLQVIEHHSLTATQSQSSELRKIRMLLDFDSTNTDSLKEIVTNSKHLSIDFKNNFNIALEFYDQLTTGPKPSKNSIIENKPS